MRHFAIKAAAGLVFCLALCGSLRADTVTVGTTSGANCYPFLCNDSGTSSGLSINYQQVYASSSFSAPMEIDSITFFFAPWYGGTGAVLNGDYSISLSYTGAAVGGLTDDLNANIGASNTLFYNGALGGSLTNPTFTINGTPFVYDPANGNLLMTIIVMNQTDSANPNGRGYLQGDRSGTATTRAYVLGSGATSASDDFDMGLVTQFSSAPAAIPEPASLLLISTGLLVLGGRARKLLNLKR